MGWIALWFLSALTQPVDYSLEVPPEERSVTEIRSDLRKAMQYEAQQVDGTAEHRKSIFRLLSLHCEMVRHSTFSDGFALKQSRSLLQSRLVRVARKISRDTKQTANVPAKPQFIPQLFQSIPVLAQRLGGQGGGGFGAAGNGGGGLGAGGGGLGTGIGQLPDYGPDLVDLIQRVISPDSWDITGGAGTIVYYAPLHAIVVRGTHEMHESIVSLLFDLRAAGGP